MLHIHHLRRKFYEAFGSDAEQAQIYFSPGRVCLIGEHIDYNGGLVFAAAISYGIYGVFHPDDSNVLKLRSGLEQNEVAIMPDNEIIYSEKSRWGNYPAGVIKYLKHKGFHIPGGELLFESNLPVGAGLSSSAALEVLTAFIFSSQDSNPIDSVELAKLCKKAENDFVGVQCGIMDQFAVMMGKKNHAVMLDCHSLAYQLVPVELGEHCMVIFNTNKKRELTDSLFNQRVAECNEALKSIQQHQNIHSLANADESLANDFVFNPVAKKRALHVIQENKRVRMAADALMKKDIHQFGLLLFQSHASLKYQYEVTGFELDTLEEAARNHPACIGAKMSGAGFGGCAFAIVKKEALDDFVQHVLETYHTKTGLEATPYFAEIDDGVRRLA